MEKQEFYNLINDVQLCTQTKCDELDDLLSRYPFFTAGRIVKLLALYKTDINKFKSELAKQSIFIPNRRYLVSLLSELNEVDSISKTKEAEPKVAKEELEEKPPKESKEKSAAKKKTTAKKSTKSKKTAAAKSSEVEGSKPAKKRGRPKKKRDDDAILLIDNDEKPTITIDADSKKTSFDDTDILELIENGSEAQNNTSDLIEKFITEQPTIPRPVAPQKPVEAENVEDISVHSVKEPEELATETLAEIYALQGYIDKAITVYEKLRLKYPEKSSYFADQIEKLKKEQQE
ncbi:hypothetical protein [Tenuifilum thalassicum]|uniref:Tetratricopeptide repeat protein n=1 Tax=Tenuifilum thalassicum TaxID=2590900 RepID=A0A7D4C1P6_9BACT|nr:hypothetical protein [Tenuifilum thalassicum]QKG80904.1 hypothetical protein FHG85_11735 [Tenuifilum thalassicum]